MPRWDYDTVFYRVFCITLLGVAFTFTVILTNVFVDIDGLLSKKDKGKMRPSDPIQNDISEVMKANHLVDDENVGGQSDASEDIYEDNDYQDSTDLYRNKRSLDEFSTLLKESEYFGYSKQLDEAGSFEDVLNQLDSDSRSNKNKKYNTEKVKEILTTEKPKANNLMIKTFIDISSPTNDKTHQETDRNSKDKPNGFIKLIDNGESIKFKSIDEYNLIYNINVTDSPNKDTKSLNSNLQIKQNHNKISNYIQNSQNKKKINDFIKKVMSESGSLKPDRLISRKRLKRHIKIRYDQEKTTAKPKIKKEDDELFVEIETHFDSKGTNGEKKKKMIRNLINKIQKAIHSDQDVKKKKQKHWHVKKRVQDPLSSKSTASFLNKLVLPLETLAHRHIDPISKAVPAHEDVPLVSNDWGRNHWHNTYVGPKFFSKSINSAEMNTVDTDYNKVMKFNGIPQRLQKPINTDMSEEALENSNVIDLGNIKFLMKDVDGSGFTVGFNHYTDELPDPETMKLFSGIENIIKTYHQKYDQDPDIPTEVEQESNNNNENNNSENVSEVQEYQQTENDNKHVIERRSIKQINKFNDKTNEYYNDNYLPVKNYQDIFNFDKRYTTKIKNDKHSTSKIRKVIPSFILNGNLFEKKLKPSEILTIANLFRRRKRSMSVKKISNIRIKNNINRYINTKSMATKRVFLNKKRHKRQIDKIKIIARDLPNLHRNVEEDVFVVSDEKIYADRAVVREVSVPMIKSSDKVNSVEHYDFISPRKDEDHYAIIAQPDKESEDTYDVMSPYLNDPPLFKTNDNEFTRHARHNSLMSKYPHIILEDTDSKEDMITDNHYPYETVMENFPAQTYKSDVIDDEVVLPILNVHSNNAQEITGIIPSPGDNSNYKMTVKIRPKNSTGMDGFKEIHTSINKSFNKNGLLYTSLVNVSELSKVEKINKNISDKNDSENMTNLNEQQRLIKTLIQQHKHRIDEQLRQLRIDKEKLETLNIDNIPKTPDAFVEVPVPLNPEKTIHLSKDDLSKLLKFDSPTTTTMITTNTVPITIKPTLITTTTEKNTHLITVGYEKAKIIRTIERNENMTNEILKKIDQNTSVLKIFLGKLIDKIDVSSRKENLETTTNTIREETTQSNNENNHTENRDNLRFVNHVPLFGLDYHQNVPLFFNNIQRHQNNTIGIPFVYAIQKPYSMVNNETPIASMVYHGHIHTNVNDKDAYLKTDAKTSNYYKTDHSSDVEGKNTPKPEVIKNVIKEFWKPNPGEKVLHNFVRQNNSRFFIDELQNDYKMLPIDKTSFKTINVKGNETKT